ncbi:amidohydrolase family protein, partial [Candidatus Hodarchaeum mangrovi]
MVFLRKLFFKYGLIGPDLDLEENVLISIDQEGKIKEINTKVHLAITDNIPHYNSHLLVPKFINTHTHVGDAILKDLAYNKTLDEAVGENGLKFDIANIPKLDRVRAMRFALLEMIDCGISTCFDFRENGLQGILELLEASRDLPINVHILGRPQNSNKLEELVPYIKGLGLSTPIYYNKEEIQSFKLFVDNKNLWLGTHIAENNDVVLNAINKFGISDLQLALKYLKPNFLVHLTSLNHEELLSIPPDIFLIFCPRS